MPRRKPKTQRGGREQRPLHAPLSERREAGPRGDADRQYTVRRVVGAEKTYRCPGCDQEIAPGVPHIVAWPAEYGGGLEDRRHWHTGCWNGRATRSVTRRWS